MNLENALTAMVTLFHAKMAGDLRPLWASKVKACQNGGQITLA